GPKALITGGVALLLNATFIALFYKELKLSTFDARLAATLGFAPTVLHYAQMTLVSVTAVVSFDAVGSVLVIALMIGPAATAYLLTDRLDRMLYLSVGIAVLGALLGYNLARVLDASIAGSMAACIGLVFGLTYLLAPERGLLAIWQRRRTQRWHFATKMLAIHLQQHEGEPEQDRECHVGHLQEHFRWQASFADRVVQQAQTNGFVQRQGDALHLTEAGRLLANEAVVNRR
ncbi:MAG: metal ABC transporter permease, partial [Bacteroidota bacterium]